MRAAMGPVPGMAALRGLRHAGASVRRVPGGGGLEGQGKAALLARLECAGCQWKGSVAAPVAAAGRPQQQPRVKPKRMRLGRKREREALEGKGVE